MKAHSFTRPYHVVSERGVTHREEEEGEEEEEEEEQEVEEEEMVEKNKWKKK